MNWDQIKQRLDMYEKLMRLDKPIGILLLLWPTLWALWIAGRGHPDPLIVWIFVLGTVLMRSAGCVINDFADRDFDPHVERTRERPLAAGKVSAREALLLAGGLSLLAFLLVLQLNRLTLLLSFAALFLAASYPFTKRFFSIPQAYLGVAFGFGIPMAFAAQLEAVPAPAWWLLVANILWAIAYDTEYAMVDRDDDLRIGMKTSAITLGRFDVAAVMAFYATYLAGWSWLGVSLGLGGWFLAGIGAAAAQAVWHYTLIRSRTREGCFEAFKRNHWLGFAVFAGVAADFALR
jgi:4-hydroxybenzoate polyprenyltransferase